MLALYDVLPQALDGDWALRLLIPMKSMEAGDYVSARAW